MNSIPLVVDVPEGLSSGVWPVTFGVPFADDDVEGLAGDPEFTVARAGTPLPTQSRVTRRYPSGRVRWVSIDFAVDAAQAGPYELRVATPPSPELFGPLLVDEGGTSNSPIRLKSGSRSEVASVTRDGTLGVGLGSSIHGATWSTILAGRITFVVRSDGEEYRATIDPSAGDVTVVEEAGELRTTLRSTGWFRSEAGEEFCRFDIRFDFFAGRTLARIRHTLIYTAMAASKTIDRVAILLPVAPNARVRFGVDADHPELTAPSGTQRLTQLLDSTRCPEISVDDGPPEPGRSSGWMSVESRSGRIGLAFAIRDAWQNAPAGFVREEDGVAIELWPSSPVAGVLDLHPLKILERSYGGKSALDAVASQYCHIKRARGETAPDPRGIAKTHEVWIEAWKRPDDGGGARLSIQAHHPVFALASPSHNCATRVLGPLHPEDRERFPSEEEALAALFQQFVRWQLEWRGYGWLIFGDVHTDVATISTGDGTAGAAHLSGFKRLWAASHYGFPKVPWILFFRSGRREYLEFAEANSRHVMDLDRCHHGDLPTIEGVEGARELTREDFPKTIGPCCFSYDKLRRFRGHHFWDEGTLIPGDGQPLVTNYEVLQFMAYGADLRGERRGLDVLTDWARAVEHFHPMDNVDQVLVANGDFLRLFYRVSEVESAYRHAEEAGVSPAAKRLPFDNVRHIAPPLGNLVEWRRAVDAADAGDWDTTFRDYVETLLSIAEASPVLPMTTDSFWHDVRTDEFRSSAGKLRHAWSGLIAALEWFRDHEGPDIATPAMSALHARLRAAVADWAYRSAAWIADNSESFEDVGFGAELWSSESGDEAERKLEDLLDLGRARLGLLVSRTNAGTETYADEGPSTCPALPRWEDEVGPRGSNGETLIRQTYALQSVPVFLKAMAAAGLDDDSSDSWFRMVGPKVPSLHVSVHDVSSFRVKLRLGVEQRLRASFADGSELVIQQNSSPALGEDGNDVVWLEERIAAFLATPLQDGDEFTLGFDPVSELDDETLAIQRATIDVLRVEGADVRIDAQQESLVEWDASIHPLTPDQSESFPRAVFRVFGRRFFFEVPGGTSELEVRWELGHQQGFKSFCPVLRVRNPSGDEDGVATPATIDTFSAQDPNMRSLVVKLGSADGEPLQAGWWSFGPIAHMVDPFRRREHRDDEAAGNIGYRSWVRVLLDGSSIDALYPNPPTNE